MRERKDSLQLGFEVSPDGKIAVPESIADNYGEIVFFLKEENFGDKGQNEPVFLLK